MQIKQVPVIVETLAAMVHTVWQTWLATVLLHGQVPPESRVIIPSMIVNRWRKLSTVSYESLTRIEKDAYRDLAEEMEVALAKEFVIIPNADYENKIDTEVMKKISVIYPDLLDCLVYARGEALASNSAMAQKSTRCLAYFSKATNPGQRVAVLTPIKKGRSS